MVTYVKEWTLFYIIKSDWNIYYKFINSCEHAAFTFEEFFLQEY